MPKHSIQKIKIFEVNMKTKTQQSTVFYKFDQILFML